MKMKYYSPLILDGSGSINLTVSQLADLGIADVALWKEFVEEWGEFFPSDFSLEDQSTWEKYGFDPADSETWYSLLQG